MTSMEDYVKKLIHCEIKKRQKKKYNNDIMPSDSSENNNKKKLNSLEENEINTSLLKTPVEEKYFGNQGSLWSVELKKKVKEKKSLSKISHKEMKKHKTNTKRDVRFQKYFENNIPIVGTGKTNNNKIYKCNICIKSFKHHSALKKHEAKAHNLFKDIPIAITNTLNILKNDKYMSQLKTQVKIMKKEKKKGSEMMLHKEIKKHKKNTECDVHSQEYFDKNILMVYTNKTNNSKLYKNDICEKYLKHRSDLKKHKTKTHDLNKEASIITADILNTLEDDEAYTSLLKTQMKKMKKRRKKIYKAMTEELMPSNKIVKHKENTICDVRPKKYLNYNITAVSMEETCNIEIYKCDVCEKSFECDSALNKHKKKAHISNNDTTVTDTVNISQNSEDEEFTLLLKKFYKKMKKKKKMKNDSKVGIQYKTQMLPTDTKKHKLYTVAKEPHKEHLGNDTGVIHTNETNKSNVCLKSFECNSTMNKYKAKDHNKRKVPNTLKSKKPVVTTVNTLNTLENEKECKLLLKTLVEKTSNKKHLNKVQVEMMLIKKVSEQKKCDEHKEYVERNCTAIEHMEKMNNDKIYKCNVCKKTFDILSALSEQKTTEDIECNICCKLFSTKFALSKHYRLHTGERPYMCDVCGKTFVQKICLTTHCRLHTGERPYACDVCDKTFVQKTCLTTHYRLHTGKRPYTCNKCGKTFVHKSNLSKHYRLHTGKKPYKCDNCGRTFTEKRTLTVHYRLHTGERPYSCDTCGKSFIQKCDLTTHYRWHTGERPYSCNLCGRGFMEKRTLTIHNRLHTGERPYECSLCERSFTRNSALHNHIRSIHEKYF